MGVCSSREKMPVPESMAAWRVQAFGADGNPRDAIDNHMTFEKKVPTPKPGQGHVLIKVEYASINPIDWKLLSGGLQGLVPVSFPYTPGFDVSGVVAQVGAGVTNVAVGDEVIANIGLVETCKQDTTVGPCGAFAEYALALDSTVCKRRGLSGKEGAGLCLAGLTSYQALFTGSAKSFQDTPLGSVTTGTKVVILGGSTATGAMAIQMAKAAGATVATTASSRIMGATGKTKIDYVKALGADVVVEYDREDWSDKLAGQEYDIVYDCVGDANDIEKAGKVLKKDASFVSIANHGGKSTDKVKYLNFLARSTGSELEKLVQMAVDKKLSVPVGEVVPFDKVNEAFRLSQDGKVAGKVVIDVCSNSKVPETMAAWRVKAFGAEGNPRDAIDNHLTLEKNVPTPKPGQGHVLIKVEYASINPIDWKLLSGGLQGMVPVSFPYTPGFDVSGVVMQVGSGVSHVAVGDEVIANIGLLETCKSDTTVGPCGAFAEYALALDSTVTKRRGLSAKEGAGLCLAGLTSYQALFTGSAKSAQDTDLGKVSTGTKVVILGGSTATGAMAIQMAKDAGATVATTASSRIMGSTGKSKIDYVKGLGADVVVQYDQEDWTEKLAGQEYDLVYDCVGEPTDIEKAGKVLKQNAPFISIANHGGKSTDKVKYLNFLARSTGSELEKLVQLITDKKLSVPVGEVVPFDKVKEAFQQSQEGKAAGKVIIDISAKSS